MHEYLGLQQRLFRRNSCKILSSTLQILQLLDQYRQKSFGWTGEPFTTYSDLYFHKGVIDSYQWFIGSLFNHIYRRGNGNQSLYLTKKWLIKYDLNNYKIYGQRLYQFKLRKRYSRCLYKINSNPIKLDQLKKEIFPNHCPVVNCDPGYYKVYGNISDYGFTWQCFPCPDNYFKSVYGNTRCRPCTGKFSISNTNKTACLDPYQDIYDHADSVQTFIIIVALSGIGFLVTFSITVLFTLKRHTPIVKTSDFVMSTIHLSFNSLIFALSPTAFFLKPDPRYCLLKPITISVLYTLSVSLMFIKSQKLLQAFLSKVRITSGEAKRTIWVQCCLVLVFLLTSNFTLFLTVYQVPVELLTQEDSTEMSRHHYCNTFTHNNVLITLMIVLQLLCSVQAFRGRHLPSVMNDGVILTYTTFTLTVTLTVTLPITIFQQLREKEVTQCVALLINNAISMLLLYGLKAFRMIKYPEQNTKAYFQTKLLSATTQRVQHRMEMNKLK